MGRLNGFLERLHGVLAAQTTERARDAQLLDEFIRQRDNSAFAALVHRHGPMVWAVCRRVLHHVQDAEDAFQATFLVLVRKAGSISPRWMVGGWLHGVAYRTALKARGQATKRRQREGQVDLVAEPQASESDRCNDLQPELDQELDRLPADYRAAIVQCDLEGRTHKQAAQVLGWPVGTLSTRLLRGRKLLAQRLGRRGIGISAVALPAVLMSQRASQGVPGTVLASTIKAGSVYVIGGASAGVVPANVAALTEGIVKTMLLSKIKVITTVVLVASVVALGAGSIAYRTGVAQAGQGERCPPADHDKQKSSAAPAGSVKDMTKDTDSPSVAPRAVELSPPLTEEAESRPWANKLFKETEWDFGKCKQGETLKHRFAMENPYKVPLDVTVRTSCGCSTATLGKATLKVSEKGYLDVVVDSSRFAGKKFITIYAKVEGGSYSSEAKLTVTAESAQDSNQEPPKAHTDVVEINARKMKLPFSLQPDSGGKIIGMRLWVSSDSGNTWTKVADAAPADGWFSYTAPSDGTYWFMVQTVDRAGRAEPGELAQGQLPALKVRVKTAP
jgi:RNA polymerase sigma factor (sigma-70 family)